MYCMCSPIDDILICQLPLCMLKREGCSILCSFNLLLLFVCLFVCLGFVFLFCFLLKCPQKSNHSPMSAAYFLTAETSK